MRIFNLLSPLFLLPSLALASDKRGLVQVDTQNPNDEKNFLADPTTIKWYYNYRSAPSSSISNLEFVPMLWGEPAASYDFATEVRKLLGKNDIKYVLGFNEPDMDRDVGGSNMSPERAVEVWKQMIQPLKDVGLKLGAPSTASTQGGKKWIKEFMEKCDNCTGSWCFRPSFLNGYNLRCVRIVDFIPLHWYGNFEGLSSHIGEVRAMFPDKDMWVTEFGYAHQSL